MKTALFTIAALTSFSALAAHAQSGDEAETKVQETNISAFADEMQFGSDGYTSTDGETLYQTLCAGCHMPDGSGAVGAGAYPALKGNTNLEYAAYPITLIVNGQAGMPGFGTFLDDEQIVALTSFIQSNLGNDYTPDATVETVAGARPTDPADPNTAEHE